MNVLIVNKYITKEAGVEEYIRQIAGAHYEDINITILACGEKSNRQQINIPARLVLTKTDIVLASTPFSFDFARKYKEEIKKADVIHFHTPYPFAELIAWFWRKEIEHKKVLVTYHAPVIGKKFLKFFVEPFQQWLFRRADRIVATSPVMQTCKDLLPYTSKTMVIPCAAKDYGPPKPHDFSYVLAVGRLVPYKGFEYLINAMATTPYKLLIAGGGPLHTKLKNIIVEAKAEATISLEGEVSESRLQFLYEHASIFVLPSVSESEAFGIVQAEAMSVGLPVVNTELPTGVPWVARNGEEAITVPPKDVKKLCDAITKLIVDTEEYKRLSLHGRDRYEKLFTINHLQKSYQTLYKDLMSKDNLNRLSNNTEIK